MTNNVTLTQDQIDAVKAIVGDAIWSHYGDLVQMECEISSRLDGMRAPEVGTSGGETDPTIRWATDADIEQI